MTAAESSAIMAAAEPFERRGQRRLLLVAAGLLVAAFVPLSGLPAPLQALLPALCILLATAPLFASFARGGSYGRMALFAALWWGCGCIWLCGLDPVLGPFAWLAAIILAVLQTAPLGWVLARLRTRWGVSDFLWWAPIAYTGWEWARSFPPTGTPWFSLGYAFWKLPVLCQLAEVTGVPGISFVIATIGAGLARPLLGRRDDRLQLALGVGLFGGLLFYGTARLATIDVTSGRTVRVALVQPDIAFQEKKATPAIEQFESVMALTRGIAPGEDLVIWPETAVPALVERPPYRGELAAQARRMGCTLVAGAFHEVVGDGTWPPADLAARGLRPISNAAILFGPDGGVADVYSKVRLVVFGEYTPGRQYPWISPIARQSPQFFAGRRLRAVDTPLGRLGLGICYESVFPGDCRAFVRDGAQALVILTNDDQLLQMGARQHFEQAVFRCIENRRWMARVANGGISAVIDPAGRVVAASNWDERTVVRGELHLRGGRTLEVRLGGWFGALCAIMTLVAMFAPRPRRPRGED
jgi:apolipoprotein N-acyltransferase